MRNINKLYKEYKLKIPLLFNQNLKIILINTQNICKYKKKKIKDIQRKYTNNRTKEIIHFQLIELMALS